MRRLGIFLRLYALVDDETSNRAGRTVEKIENVEMIHHDVAKFHSIGFSARRIHAPFLSVSPVTRCSSTQAGKAVETNNRVLAHRIEDSRLERKLHGVGAAFCRLEQPGEGFPSASIRSRAHLVSTSCGYFAVCFLLSLLCTACSFP